MKYPFGESKTYRALKNVLTKYATDSPMSTEKKLKNLMKVFSVIQNNLFYMTLYKPHINKLVIVIVGKMKEIKETLDRDVEKYTKTNKINYLTVKFIKFMITFIGKDYYGFFEKIDKIMIRDFERLLATYTDFYNQNYRRYNLRKYKLNA